MTFEVTELAKKIEAQMVDLAKAGASEDKVISFSWGYRAALCDLQMIGDIEDEALGRFFESWKIPADLVIEP